MNIKIEKYTLKTYSKDLICVQLDNNTLTSSFDIRTCLNYLERNNIKGVKNRCEEVILDLSIIDKAKLKNTFKTKNYTVNRNSKIEYEVVDNKNKNNIRWILDCNLMQKLYLLEINRLEVTSIDDLVVAIGQLNINFKKIMEN